MSTYPQNLRSIQQCNLMRQMMQTLFCLNRMSMVGALLCHGKTPLRIITSKTHVYQVTYFRLLRDCHSIQIALENNSGFVISRPTTKYPKTKSSLESIFEFIRLFFQKNSFYKVDIFNYEFLCRRSILRLKQSSDIRMR